jgi:hypothetical protein
MAELLTVLDPRGYPPKVVGKRLAPRPEGLDGKLVYLVDCLFDNWSRASSPRSADASVQLLLEPVATIAQHPDIEGERRCRRVEMR